MSINRKESERKALKRRVKMMAAASKLVGPKVRMIALYDETDIEQKVTLATMLAQNVNNPGSIGLFMAGATVINENGYKVHIVRDGLVRDALLKFTEICPNLMGGWAWDELAKVFSLAPTDKRLERILKGVTGAFRKLGLVVERFNGYFKVLTKSEVAVKQARMLSNIEGQAKSRAQRGRALIAGGINPNGTRNIQLKWWELLQFDDIEGEAA